jgi:hypothetical protein
MRRPLFMISALLLCLSLTACVPSRGDADRKLAVACQAAIKATFTDPKDNIAVQTASFDFQKSYDGAKLRVVTLKAKYTYGDSEPDDKTYTCSYTEEWSLFSYLPEFYNLQRDDQTYGNVNGEIMGDTNTLIKINDALQKTLN